MSEIVVIVPMVQALRRLLPPERVKPELERVCAGLNVMLLYCEVITEGVAKDEQGNVLYDLAKEDLFAFRIAYDVPDAVRELWAIEAKEHPFMDAPGAKKLSVMTSQVISSLLLVTK